MFEKNQGTLEILRVIIHISNSKRLAYTTREADEARLASRDPEARLMFTSIAILCNEEAARRVNGGLADLTLPADIQASLLLMPLRTLATMLEICVEHEGALPGRKIALRKAVVDIIKQRRPAPPETVDVSRMLSKNVMAPAVEDTRGAATFTKTELDYLGRAVCYYPDCNWNDHQLGDILVAKLGALLRGSWLT